MPTPVERLRALIFSELTAINGITRDAMTVLVFEWESVSREHKEELEALRLVYERYWLDTLAQIQKEAGWTEPVGVRRSLLRGAIAWTATWYKREGGMHMEDLSEVVLAMAFGGTPV